MPPADEVDAAARYEGQFRERQIDAAVRLFEAQGVGRHDTAARAESMLRNFDFFGAPHAAFLFIPAGGGLREAADCSKFAQTFMLALAAAGLGSCPQGALSSYPAAVRQRSEEHTSELQSLMRISYAVFCLKKKKTIHTI